MSRSHHRRIGRQAAEQLLDGAAGPGAGPDQLARVLAAAAAAGRESELSGEQAAMAAFEAHHLVPVPASRRGQMIKSPLAKLLTVKVLAISTAAFATGGVALAASNGALTGSGPASGHAISQSASPGGIAALPTAPASTAPATLPSAPPSASAPASGGAVAPGGTVPGGAPVVAGAAALCRTLAARADPTDAAASLEQALASPRVARVAGGSMFSSLVATAHGVANVPDYCGLLLDLPQLPQPDGLSQLPAPVLAKALTQLPTGTLGQILIALPASALSQVLTALPAATLSQVLTKLPAPDLAKVLTSLPAPVRSQILGELPTSVLSQLPDSGLLHLPG